MGRLENTAEYVRLLCERSRKQRVSVSVVNGVIRPWQYGHGKAGISEMRIEPYSGEYIGTIICARPPMIYEDDDSDEHRQGQVRDNAQDAAFRLEERPLTEGSGRWE